MNDPSPTVPKPKRSPAAMPHDGVAANGERSGRRTAGQVVKDIALFFAAPFISIVYIALFPAIAVMLLVRHGRHSRQP